MDWVGARRVDDLGGAARAAGDQMAGEAGHRADSDRVLGAFRLAGVPGVTVSLGVPGVPGVRSILCTKPTSRAPAVRHARYVRSDIVTIKYRPDPKLPDPKLPIFAITSPGAFLYREFRRLESPYESSLDY